MVAMNSQGLIETFNRDNIIKGADNFVYALSAVGVLGVVTYIGKKWIAGEPIVDGNKPNSSIGNVLWNMANIVSKASSIAMVVFAEMVGFGIAIYLGKSREYAQALLRADTALLGLVTIKKVIAYCRGTCL